MTLIFWIHLRNSWHKWISYVQRSDTPTDCDRKLSIAEDDDVYSLKSLTLPFTYTAPLTPFCLYPDRAFNNVDLPAPLGPMMAIKFPLGKVPLTLWRISFLAVKGRKKFVFDKNLSPRQIVLNGKIWTVDKARANRKVCRKPRHW